MAGGTGGHVFPALAVARLFQRAGIPVEWLGTKRGIEADVVPQAGLQLHAISVSGIRGKGWLTAALAPARLLLALVQSCYVILRFKPTVVLGMGGFASGPGGVAAWLLRRPLVIHEQNAIAGVTNRMLARFATRVLEGFPKSFPGMTKALWVGNPVREELMHVPSPRTRFDGRQGPLRLLVVGGSQGATALNRICPEALSLLPEMQRPEVWHQTGKTQENSTREAYLRRGLSANVEPFIQDMARAYEWADCVLCRGGALTISELAMIGIGSILVPFPSAVDDHQTHNSHFLAAVGAAQVVPQQELSAKQLADRIAILSNNRAALFRMAESAKTVAKPDACLRVFEICKEVCCAG